MPSTVAGVRGKFALHVRLEQVCRGCIHSQLSVHVSTSSSVTLCPWCMLPTSLQVPEGIQARCRPDRRDDLINGGVKASE